MKKLALVFMAAFLAVSFIACSPSSGNNAGENENVQHEAVYKYTEDDWAAIITFKTDGTYICTTQYYNDDGSLQKEVTEGSGTYTGDASKDGEISLTYEQDDKEITETYTIKDGSFKMGQITFIRQ